MTIYERIGILAVFGIVVLLTIVIDVLIGIAVIDIYRNGWLK